MKLFNQNAFTLTSKQLGKLILPAVISILPFSATMGQNISVNVNSYLKERVKETAIRGTVLIAENMTDWLSETIPAPEKTTKCIASKPVKVTRSHTPAAVKAKYVAVASKPLKRT